MSRKYDRRSFLKNVCMSSLALSSLGFFTERCSRPTDDRKPNIIFILVDDMGWSDLGCYGSEIDTPTIDNLAQKGKRFTQCYNTAKSFPSRACLLTGVYAQKCGMGKDHGNITNAVTLGEVLKTQGYRTLASGKHHGDENLYNRGFDHYYGLRDGCCNFWNPGTKREEEPKPARKRTRYWCDDKQTYYPFTPEDKYFYTTDVFTDKALDWLDKPEAQKNPFFLYLAYTAPHYPLHAWPEDIEKYKGKYDQGYQSIQKQRYKRQIEMGLIDPDITPIPDTPTPEPWDELNEETTEKEKRRMEIYAAMLDRVDQNINRIVTKLEKQGKLDNTLILFASDNGACPNIPTAKYNSTKIEDFGTVESYEAVGENWATVQNTPLRYWKNWSHEGGICTPLIAFWPNNIKNPGSFYREPVHFIDIMATLVDITDANYPKTYRKEAIVPMQGTSILPAFEDKPIQREKPLYWQWGKGGAIRKNDMKAVFYDEDWELYNIKEDRNEAQDLSKKKSDQLQDLKNKWENWYISVNNAD